MTKAKPCVHDGCRASSNFIKKDGFCHGLRLVDVTKITPPYQWDECLDGAPQQVSRKRGVATRRGVGVTSWRYGRRRFATEPHCAPRALIPHH